MYLPLKVKSPFITIYPPFTLFYLPPLPFPSADHHTVLCLWGFPYPLYLNYSLIYPLMDIFGYLFLFLFMYLFLSSPEDNFYCFLFIFKFYCIFLHYHLTPLHSPLLHCSHHIVVCVHESFFLFAAPLHPLPPRHSCQSALCLWVCLYFPC